jgi:hypothetical protein
MMSTVLSYSVLRAGTRWAVNEPDGEEVGLYSRRAEAISAAIALATRAKAEVRVIHPDGRVEHAFPVQSAA